eukprot:GDKJ01036947.1.p1 GENE.GDKJ01036947.1~~GDKJ01036947.1.p1  ORF type:complete len:611 (-),score=114.92 GDKJ01036947.1:52-1719(-)
MTSKLFADASSSKDDNGQTRVAKCYRLAKIGLDHYSNVMSSCNDTQVASLCSSLSRLFPVVEWSLSHASLSSKSEVIDAQVSKAVLTICSHLHDRVDSLSNFRHSTMILSCLSKVPLVEARRTCYSILQRCAKADMVTDRPAGNGNRENTRIAAEETKNRNVASITCLQEISTTLNRLRLQNTPLVSNLFLAVCEQQVPKCDGAIASNLFSEDQIQQWASIVLAMAKQRVFEQQNDGQVISAVNDLVSHLLYSWNSADQTRKKNFLREKMSTLMALIMLLEDYSTYHVRHPCHSPLHSPANTSQLEGRIRELLLMVHDEWDEAVAHYSFNEKNALSHMMLICRQLFQMHDARVETVLPKRLPPLPVTFALSTLPVSSSTYASSGLHRSVGAALKALIGTSCEWSEQDDNQVLHRGEIEEVISEVPVLEGAYTVDFKMVIRARSSKKDEEVKTRVVLVEADGPYHFFKRMPNSASTTLATGDIQEMEDRALSFSDKPSTFIETGESMLKNAALTRGEKKDDLLRIRFDKWAECVSDSERRRFLENSIHNKLGIFLC